jgi:hypothetical protein
LYYNAFKILLGHIDEQVAFIDAGIVDEHSQKSGKSAVRFYPGGRYPI